MAALSAALVGSSVVNAAGLNRSETSILIYSERDRARAREFNFDLSRQLGNAFSLGVNLTYDGLTGASPTGGSPSQLPQTLTRPSGGGQKVVVPAGAIPVDHTFTDSRFAADGTLSHPFSNTGTWTVGLHASSEHDYTSLGLNGGTEFQLDQKRTSVGIHLSLAHDVSSPVGGVPVPFAPIDSLPESDSYGRPKEGRPKSVNDVLLSVSRVLNRNTLVRVNFSYDRTSGYLSDPYKEITVVQPPDSANAGEPLLHLHESRPHYRESKALYGELSHFMFGCVMDVSYRFFWDSWGVSAHTADVRCQIDLKGTGAFQPHVRLYRQSQADFYRMFLVQGTSAPEFASADSRLGSFYALTYGLTYSVPVSAESRLTAACELYSQRGYRSPPDTFGTLAMYDLFPKLTAVMLRLGFVHEF